MRQTDYVILGLLGDAPLSGYQIKKLVDLRFRFFWSESFGQIFPALRALAAQGLIAEEPPAAGGKRARKSYRITPAGENALRAWLALPVERESYRLEILLKLYFSSRVDNEVMLAHIRAFQQAHERDLELLGRFCGELEGIVDEHEDHPRILRVIDCGQKLNAAYLAWSRETIDYLEGRGKP